MTEKMDIHLPLNRYFVLETKKQIPPKISICGVDEKWSLRTCSSSTLVLKREKTASFYSTKTAPSHSR